MSQKPAGADSLVVSYLFLRKCIGWLGIAFPFVLAIGGWLVYATGLQHSLSGYYHTGMRDVFVGILCAIAVFLLSYKGYERDDIAGTLAGVFAVGVALFPTTPAGDMSAHAALIGSVHYVCATAFFVLLAYFSLVLFTKTDPAKPPTPEKLRRNVVYRGCGYAILLAIALIAVVKLVPSVAAAVQAFEPVFWLEAFAVVAFGVSWLTKGEAILRDA